MIPKKIHYCWFGQNPLPELAQKCIASWKKFCPDYEIIEWNESNFDVNCCDYVKEAYAAKKWAFVSDYARFKILYEYGGLYFDTDVELIKPIDDIVAKGNFIGRENEHDLSVAPGLGLGTIPHLNIYKTLLELYQTIHFINADGSQNSKTIVDYTTEIFVELGLEKLNTVQYINGIYVYPKEYFCPIDYDTNELSITNNTYSIHHYTASWYDESQRYALKLKRKYGRFFPRKIAAVLATAVAKTKYDGFGACIKWIFKKRK